jgi:transposase
VAVRDRFGELFADAEFASAFGVTGPRGWSPGRLALVTVFQMAGNLTDRQAAEAVRDRLSWAYALGLDLQDTGFDHTVLSEFRSRVVAHGLEEKVLDLLLAKLAEMGLVRAGGKLAFARGARGGVLMTWMPSASKTLSKARVYLPSLSRITNRNVSTRAPRSIARFRAC